MAEAQTYSGSCQCGAVAYEVTADISTVNECNCSICSKKGLLLAFAPETQFALKKGGSHLTEYKFHKHRIAHLFCSTCGVQSFAKGAMPDGTKMVAINVRCLDGVDLSKLVRKPIDGKSF